VRQTELLSIELLEKLKGN